MIILSMSTAEFYAAILRIILWSQNALDATQQDMAIKNVLFLSACASAYSMFTTSAQRDW